jgi:hypothetical protein
MKKGTLVMHSVAAVAGMTSLANATTSLRVADQISAKPPKMEAGQLWAKMPKTSDQR